MTAIRGTHVDYAQVHNEIRYNVNFKSFSDAFGCGREWPQITSRSAFWGKGLIVSGGLISDASQLLA